MAWKLEYDQLIVNNDFEIWEESVFNKFIFYIIYLNYFSNLINIVFKIYRVCSWFILMYCISHHESNFIYKFLKFFVYWGTFTELHLMYGKTFSMILVWLTKNPWIWSLNKLMYVCTNSVFLACTYYFR